MGRLVVVLLVVTLLVAVVTAAPEAWLNLHAGRRPQAGHSRGRSVAGGGKARYKAICRTINPDNYAFRGRLPYPAAPVCPY